MNKKRDKKTETIMVERTGRRQFLSRIWKVLGLISFAELGIFTISMLRPGKKALKNNIPSPLKIVGNVDEFPSNSVTPDRINKFFLVRMADGGFMALSLTCSHLGCSVLWDEGKGQFICPCHSSSFDRVGNVISSPAPRPLDYYPVIVESGKVKVDISAKQKRKIFEKKQVTYAI